MTQEITQDYLKSILHYDKETGLFTWINSSRIGWNGKIAGCLDQRYLRIRVLNKSYLAHRLAWLHVYGYMPEYIDHINRKTTDNRICNLRVATKAENCMNQKIKSNNTSGVKGVSWHKLVGKWLAYITVDKKLIRLGYFSDINDAESCVNQARLKYHKEFSSNGV